MTARPYTPHSLLVTRPQPEAEAQVDRLAQEIDRLQGALLAEKRNGDFAEKRIKSLKDDVVKLQVQLDAAHLKIGILTERAESDHTEIERLLRENAALRRKRAA